MPNPELGTNEEPKPNPEESPEESRSERVSDDIVLALAEGSLSEEEAAEVRAKLQDEDGIARLAHAYDALHARGVKPSKKLSRRMHETLKNPDAPEGSGGTTQG